MLDRYTFNEKKREEAEKLKKELGLPRSSEIPLEMLRQMKKDKEKGK